MHLTSVSAGLVALVVLGAWTTFSWSQSQPPLVPPPQPKGQLIGVPPASQAPARDLAKWPAVAKQVFLNAKSASEWLKRANGSDGRFAPGWLPALGVRMEGDSYLRQAGAAFALGKAAKYYDDPRAAAIARQAVLTLLVDTALEDPRQPGIVVCTLAAGVANPLGAAGTLVQAICELPNPASDVLDRADQLCSYIRRAQAADGSFRSGDPALDGKGGADGAEALQLHAGEALCGLMCSQQHRPAAWKLEVVRKALPYYQPCWRAAKNLAMVPRHTAAYAEAYLQTGDKAFADFVFEMNDWLCSFQFKQLDPQHPLWVGGFMGCVEGKPAPAPPQASSAVFADSLVLAARVARQVGDVARWEKYKAAQESCLQFLGTLQFTDVNSQHFTERFRPTILGALHGSHTDGNVRLDYTSQAVSAMVGYLTHVAEVH